MPHGSLNPRLYGFYVRNDTDRPPFPTGMVSPFTDASGSLMWYVSAGYRQTTGGFGDDYSAFDTVFRPAESYCIDSGFPKVNIE